MTPLFFGRCIYFIYGLISWLYLFKHTGFVFDLHFLGFDLHCFGFRFSEF